MVALQPGVDALAERRHLGAGKIDFPVPSHEELDGVEARVASAERAGLVHIFVAKVFNGVAQDLQRMTRLGADLASSCASFGSPRLQVWSRKQNTRHRCWHALILALLIDHGAPFLQITEVPLPNLEYHIMPVPFRDMA
jgi:hypothetical protein